MQASVILGGKQVVINKFDSNDIDILTEIGNIGTGNAATALSKYSRGGGYECSQGGYFKIQGAD